jgi:hypothetical protein
VLKVVTARSHTEMSLPGSKMGSKPEATRRSACPPRPALSSVMTDRLCADAACWETMISTAGPEVAFQDLKPLLLAKPGDCLAVGQARADGRGHDDETGARLLSRSGRLPEQTEHEKSCSAHASAAANAGCHSLRSMRTWARFARARSAFTGDIWLIAELRRRLPRGGTNHGGQG